MDTETEQQLMEAWYDLTESHPNSQERFRLIKSAFRQLLPEGIDSAAVAFVADEPTILAVAGTRIFSVQVISEDEGSQHAVVRSLPLDAACVMIEAFDSTGTLPDGTEAAMRSWKFTWDRGSVLAFSTVLRRAGWRDGPDLGEDVAATMAAKLGWLLPGHADG